MDDTFNSMLYMYNLDGKRSGNSEEYNFSGGVYRDEEDDDKFTRKKYQAQERRIADLEFEIQTLKSTEDKSENLLTEIMTEQEKSEILKTKRGLPQDFSSFRTSNNPNDNSNENQMTHHDSNLHNGKGRVSFYHGL